ncbi:MAG: GNAT family N-acetyltransferase, partial [Defluviitaleaceae bacterium]|nr:GNAT family N-acetyltransferase [Defluviitaleaceae bacterium]
MGLYAHDLQAKDALFSCGFGLRMVDAVRPVANFEYPDCEGITFEELAKSEVSQIRDMRISLSVHLGESPCFMRGTIEDRESWIARAESRDSRVFVALYDNLPVSFIEVKSDGEHFATWENSIQNICGAFCLPVYRGKGIMQGLLNYVITQLKVDKVDSLGVDFESFNLSASGFWLKHFTAYTYSVT